MGSRKKPQSDMAAAKAAMEAEKNHHGINEEAIQSFSNLLRALPPWHIKALVEARRGVVDADKDALRRATDAIREQLFTANTPPQEVLEKFGDLLLSFLEVTEIASPNVTRPVRVGAGEPFIQWVLTPIQINVHNAVAAAISKYNKSRADCPSSIELTTAYVPERRGNLKDAFFRNYIDFGLFRTPIPNDKTVRTHGDGLELILKSDYGDVVLFDFEALKKNYAPGGTVFEGELTAAKKKIADFRKETNTNKRTKTIIAPEKNDSVSIDEKKGGDNKELAGIKIGTYKYVLLGRNDFVAELTESAKAIKRHVKTSGVDILRTIKIATRLNHLHLGLKNGIPELKTMKQLLGGKFGPIVVETDNFVEATDVAKAGKCFALVPDLALPVADCCHMEIEDSQPQTLVFYAKLCNLSKPVFREYWFHCASFASELLRNKLKTRPKAFELIV